MMRDVCRICAIGCVLLGSVAAASLLRAVSPQDQAAAADPLAIPPDFPPADARIWTLQQKGLLAKLAARALTNSPDAPETVDLLVRAARLADAVAVFRRIVESRPENLERALRFVPGLVSMAARTEFREHTEILRELVHKARARLPELPREEAATVARTMVEIEGRFTRRPIADWAQSLREFVREWAGTEAGLLAEVDVINAPPATGPRKLEALDAFARQHPGTRAAAKAIHQRGFDLAHNPRLIGIDPQGEDPLKRFILVMEIVNELESGRYPPCEWVDKAPDLIIGFNVYKPAYGEGSLATMLTLYEQFAKRHFTLDHRGPTEWGIGYLITRKMADLYALNGDGVGPVERVLTELESDPTNAPAARYLRALFYIRIRGQKSTGEPDEFAARATRLLEELQAQTTAVYQRKALSTLAVLEQTQGEYSTAARYLSRYVQLYPDSPWAWVAALRLGKAHESLGDWNAASKAFLDAASRQASTPPARALGHAYAARAFEALGRFDEALTQHQKAIEHWDDDYGPTYSLYFTRPVRPDEPYTIVRDLAEVSKASLQERAAQLKEALSAPGGGILETARWQFARGQLADTIATLDRLLKQHPQSPLARDARVLSHRARLGHALDRADRAELESLEREPYDFWVTAARMARAAMLWRAGAASEAEALMMKALSDWHAHQATAMTTTPPAGLEKDLMEIRNLVFRPRGDGLFAGSQWELKSLAPAPTPFFIVNPDMSVKLSSGDVLSVPVHRPIAKLDNVLFLNSEQLAFFDSMLGKLGGTERRQPGAVMEVPNQPVGGSLDVLKLLQKFLPARPGHWGGWMVQTFPTITRIEFANPERTKAGVRVTIGYEGATVIVEKKAGVWTYREMTNRWIT